jgi:hypothetical protein
LHEDANSSKKVAETAKAVLAKQQAYVWISKTLSGFVLEFRFNENLNRPV